MSIETRRDKSIAHARYPAGEHDSIQYHFFCDGMVFSARIFRTASLEQHCFWLYDGESLQEILNSAETLSQQPIEHLHVTSRTLSLRADPDKGSIVVYANTQPIIEISFQVNNSLSYLPTQQAEPVTHLPNLTCTVVYQNKTMTGTGYCKRYFGDYPNTWDYRFVHCVMPPFTLWSADALFGRNKYHYFHLLPEGAPRVSSLNDESSVSDHTAQAVIANQRYEVHFERIASWQIRLHSDVMDSLLQQHYCHATLNNHNQTFTGLCLNETCAGTLA